MNNWQTEGREGMLLIYTVSLTYVLSSTGM